MGMIDAPAKSFGLLQLLMLLNSLRLNSLRSRAREALVKEAGPEHWHVHDTANGN